MKKSLILAALAVVLAPLAVSVLEMDTVSDASVRTGTTIEHRTVESASVAVDPGNVSVTEHAGEWIAPMTTIVVRSARSMAKDVSGCSFATRELTQGRGTVRGFCPSK